MSSLGPTSSYRARITSCPAGMVSLGDEVGNLIVDEDGRARGRRVTAYRYRVEGTDIRGTIADVPVSEGVWLVLARACQDIDRREKLKEGIRG